jgi:hypothetical protein
MKDIALQLAHLFARSMGPNPVYPFPECRNTPIPAMAMDPITSDISTGG